MTCNFTFFATIFQSYQDNGQMMNKGCVQWNLVLHFKHVSNPGDKVPSAEATHLQSVQIVKVI